MLPMEDSYAASTQSRQTALSGSRRFRHPSFRRSRCSESDSSRSNEPRPIRRSVGSLGRGVDVLTFLQFWIRQAPRNQTPAVIEQFIERAVQQKLVIPGLGIFNIFSNLGIECRGAVPGYRVIPLRMIA